jgi:hypothetical protein
VAGPTQYKSLKLSAVTAVTLGAVVVAEKLLLLSTRSIYTRAAPLFLLPTHARTLGPVRSERH